MIFKPGLVTLTVTTIVASFGGSSSADDRTVQAGRATCEAYVGKQLQSGTVTTAQYVTKGSLLGTHGTVAPKDFCQVRAKVTSTPTSNIVAEMWLPNEWNEKLMAAGGSGYSGGLGNVVQSLALPLSQGYAGVATNAGHDEPGASWARGQAQQVAEWGHLANHLVAVFAKEAVADYYGSRVSRAYFQGCSNGGRDALMEASRYPEDYDGIIAGAPAADWTGLMSSFAWDYQQVFRTPGASGITKKLDLVANAVLAKCDMLDGVADGVLENPRSCNFDPTELQCSAGDNASCLTSAEVVALKNIYRGPHLADGTSVFVGFAMGGENISENVNGPFGGTASGIGEFGGDTFRYLVYQDANWTQSQFDLEQDYPIALQRIGAIVDSHHPDLTEFTQHGENCSCITDGWTDVYQQIAQSNTSIRFEIRLARPPIK